ncbi:MAG: hypothetical protein KF832_20885 [Caldilineaceae bacterium]|nr:hypothetical protein [Caldilineaceae bacterium]
MNLQDELTLLRRFEPILRFTRGESFFPMDVEHYVRHSSLWVQRPNAEPVALVAPGELDLARLAYPYPDEFGTVHYLKFAEPLGAAEMAAQTLRQANQPIQHDAFHAGRGRLARVGYLSRLIDALFSISLLARGRVPGDAAAAATRDYECILARSEQYTYHGRVVRQDHWLVLQYWFFYPFNNWRSGFFGANDHEADWEMICLYLSEDAARGEVQPEWIAYASHDYHGDDLRRNWHDAEVEKVGEHPVVYVGAGSHASYYQQGEYLTELELALFARLTRLLAQIRAFGRRRLRQYEGDDAHTGAAELANIFRIPFVDYARGDGLSIGPGQDKPWSAPHLLNPTPSWVTFYRGLWGLYTRDPFASEDAPAGPMYNRDGSVRRAWYDPVGWAGLDKVTPLEVLLKRVAEEEVALRLHQQATQAAVEEKARELQSLGIQAAAMRMQPHLYKLYTAQQTRMATLSQEVDHLRATLAGDEALLEALHYYAQQLQSGSEPEPLRAHLRRPHRPPSEERLRATRLAEFWAAASVGLLMVIFFILITVGRRYLMVGLVTMIALVTFIEASFRGRLTRFITSVTISTAVVAAFVLVYRYFWQIVEIGVLATGLYILWENLRELRR